MCHWLPPKHGYKQNFFPDISGLHGIRIKIQDIDGNEWEFHYRYWLNGGSRIYVLEGLRDYMVSKKWQPGDSGNSGVAFPKIHYLNANFICQEGKNNFYASSDHINYTVKVKVLVVNMCPVLNNNRVVEAV